MVNLCRYRRYSWDLPIGAVSVGPGVEVMGGAGATGELGSSGDTGLGGWSIMAHDAPKA